MRRAGFMLATAGIVGGTVAGTVILSGMMTSIPLSGAMATTNFVDIVTTDTTPGKILVGGTGLACLALGGKIFYECSAVTQILKRGFTFIGEQASLASLGRLVIETIKTKQFIPNTLSELGSFATGGIATIVVVSFSIMAVITGITCFCVGWHCLKTTYFSLTQEKD